MRKFVIYLIVLVFVFISLFTFYLILKNNAIEFRQNDSSSDKEKLLTENKDAISSAENFTYREVPAISTADNIIGSSSAAVEMIIYDDYADPFLGQLNDSIKEVKENFAKQVVIAKRFYIYNDSEMNIRAIQAALCAGEQGKFWQMDELLANNALANELSDKKIQENAQSLNLESLEFNKCLANKAKTDKILRDSKTAKKYGVLGVPTIFINGQYLHGAYPFKDFTDSTGHKRKGLKSLIKDELSADD